MIKIFVSLLALSAPPATHLPAPQAMAIAPSFRAAFDFGAKFSKPPLDAPTLEAMGVALDAPAYVYLVANEGVLELALAKRAAADTSFDLALAQKKAKKLPETPGVDRAMELVTEQARLFVVRIGDRLFVTRARAAWPSVAVAAAEAATKPAAMPKWIAAAQKKPLAWFYARGIDGLERVEGVAFADKKTIDVRVNATLDFASSLLLGDLGNTPGKSRALVKSPDAVLELTAYLGNSAVANLFDIAGMPVPAGNQASGRVHAVLEKDGKLIVAVEPRAEATAEQSEALRAALATKLDGVDIRVAKGLTLGEERSPIEIRAKPKMLFEALEARAKSKSSVRPLRPEVAVAKSRLGDAAAKIETMRAELAVTPAGVELRATLSMP